MVIIIDKINYLLDYFKYLKNPIQSLFFKFGIKKDCIVKLKKSNCEIKLTSITALNRLMQSLPAAKVEKHEDFLKYIQYIENNDKIVVVDGITYVNVFNNEFKKQNPQDYNICLEEFFSDDQWDMVNFNDRYVIDIGANIADTTLFFAKENATVIGFEPVRHLFDVGVENISLNPDLKNKIQFINKGVGGKMGTLNIGIGSTKSYADSNESYEVEVITIGDVLKQYDFPADVLKMDCEGCEFEIILNEDLTMFKDIIFEHHSELVGKDYKPLIKRLEEQGFKTNNYSVSASQLDFENIGIIHAFKN